MKRNVIYILCIAILGFSQDLLAQAGMTVSPGKLYYKLTPGGSRYSENCRE
jgi:hypothetical protein